MLEQFVQPDFERDRESNRADWQRGIGMVALSQLCDRMLEARSNYTVAEAIDRSAGRSARGMLGLNVPNYWVHAFDLSREYFQSPDDKGSLVFPAKFNIEARRHTYAKTPTEIFEEGLHAQRHFPLNIASVIEKDAAYSEAQGYQLNSLLDIARLFRNPAFHDVLTTCALTRNSVWRQFSALPHVDRGIRYSIPGYRRHHWFHFPGGQVALKPELVGHLHKELKTNNKYPRTDKTYNEDELNVADRTSSGCPVNHKAPHGSTVKDHADQLAELAQTFNTTVEALTKQRKTTPIVAMTTAFADFLELAHDEYARRSGIAR